MTDQLYSLSLLLALIAGGIGVPAALAVAVHRARGTTSRPVLRLLCAVSAFCAAFFGAFSVVVHLWSGHGAGSPEPMRLARFLLQHPAYWVVSACIVAAAAGWAASRLPAARRSSSGG